MSTLFAIHASTTNDIVFLSAFSSTIGLRLVTAPTGFPGFESRIKSPYLRCESVCCLVNAWLKMSAIGFASISDPHFSSYSLLPPAQLLLRRLIERFTSV